MEQKANRKTLPVKGADLTDTDMLDRRDLQEYAANTRMRTLKVIFGLVCLVAALPLGLFAWECFLASNYAGELLLKFVPAAFTLGLICIGFF